MKILGVIPSRYASTRFPGKPLVMINGLSMINRVYNQCRKSRLLNDVIVATDDERIAEHVRGFNGRVLMTAEHRSGTDRCAEVMKKYGQSYDALINIQGDEPFIDPMQIDLVAGNLMKGATIATLVKAISGNDELFDPNTPKVIFNKDMNAIYFSRQTIPWVKDTIKEKWLSKHTFYKHIGIYGYRAETLPRLAALPEGLLEKAESLEQLRWIENGFTVSVSITLAESVSIDTPADLDKIAPFL